MTQDSSLRRPYLGGSNYMDMVRRPRSREIWNRIFEAFGQFAEFRTQEMIRDLKDIPAATKSALENFLRQSERKKPYYGDSFPEMEDYWEGPPGYRPRPGGPYPDIPPTEPPIGETIVFQVNTDGCHNKGGTADIVLSGTHPIYGIEFTFPGLVEAGTSFETSGEGNNEVTLSITSDASESNLITFSVLMITASGVSNEWFNNVNIFECSCVDPTPLEDGTWPDTIAQSTSAGVTVVGGTTPYNWSVTGEDFTMQFAQTAGTANNLVAGPDACGTAFVTVTDYCGQKVDFEVRSTGDSDWVTTGGVCPGKIMFDSYLGFGQYRYTSGGKKCLQSYRVTHFGSGYCNQPPGGCTGYPVVVCVDVDCTSLSSYPEGDLDLGCCHQGDGTGCSAWETFSMSCWTWECV